MLTAHDSCAPWRSTTLPQRQESCACDEKHGSRQHVICRAGINLSGYRFQSSVDGNPARIDDFNAGIIVSGTHARHFADTSILLLTASSNSWPHPAQSRQLVRSTRRTQGSEGNRELHCSRQSPQQSPPTALSFVHIGLSCSHGCPMARCTSRP